MALGTFFPSSCLLNLGGGAYSWCPPWQAMTGVEHMVSGCVFRTRV